MYDIPDNTPPHRCNDTRTTCLTAIQTSTNYRSTSERPVFFRSCQYRQPLENIGTTFKQLALHQSWSDPRTNEHQNYEVHLWFINPQEGDFTIGGFAPEYLPRAVVSSKTWWITDISWCRCYSGGVAAGGPQSQVVLCWTSIIRVRTTTGPSQSNVPRITADQNRTLDGGINCWVSGILNAIGVGGGKGASLLNKTLRRCH